MALLSQYDTNIRMSDFNNLEHKGFDIKNFFVTIVDLGNFNKGAINANHRLFFKYYWFKYCFPWFKDFVV